MWVNVYQGREEKDFISLKLVGGPYLEGVTLPISICYAGIPVVPFP